MDEVRPTESSLSFGIEGNTGDARVVVSIRGRERPRATDFWDGNWLDATVSVHARAMMGGAFDARVDATLRGDEIEGFRSEVEAVLEGTRTVARFESMEEWLRLQITGGEDGWLMTGVVSDHPAMGSTLDFRIDKVDQRQMRDLLRQLTDVLATYDVIGDPGDQ